MRSEVQGNCVYITFAGIDDVAHLIHYRNFGSNIYKTFLSKLNEINSLRKIIVYIYQDMILWYFTRSRKDIQNREYFE